MEFLDNINSLPVNQLTSFDIVINILLAFTLGVLITFVYRYTNRNKPINQSLILTLIILAMVVALVMMVIGNSIARAFSLVGALSIIRFRTVVKDNRDIAYVFFALAAGMTAGVSNYPIAVFGVGTILILLLVLDFAAFGIQTNKVYLLRFQLLPTDSDEQEFKNVFSKFLVSHTRISVKTVRMGQYVEHSYMVHLKRKASDQEFISALSAIEGMDRVNLIASESEPEI
ncbi:DUF4956 domain-containing protein [bacterium]|nr:DUF4956 domain-containing protein [bacterium]